MRRWQTSGIGQLEALPTTSRHARPWARPATATLCGLPFGPLRNTAVAMTLPVQPEIGTAAAAERRLVTVLFADVVDSTSLAERMDPEDWSGAIRSVLTLMSAPVKRYGGTVASLMGDGLLAVFGAPAAHEDDAIRAVQAGLEMIDAVVEAGPRLRREFGTELSDGPKVRVGINTGLAIVEGMGDAARAVDALGDTVNVAARM